MQQFALASVYPRSIAWLVRLDEWDRFEEIVHYNCAMVGGYYNVIIPLTEQDDISEEYQRFLVDYDPDLVVLAPEMATAQLDIFLTRIHPFGVIPWEAVSQIATLDPWTEGTGLNASLGFIEKKPSVSTYISIQDDTKPDTSRLSLVACGDVSVYGSEHKENFLQGLFKGDKEPAKHRRFDSMPNRYELVNIISEEYVFPLSNTVKNFDTCVRMQHLPNVYQSLIGLTTSYNSMRYTHTSRRNQPSIVIQVSEKFGIREATSFWNLRAGGTYVIWVSFADLESNLYEIAEWLTSNHMNMLLLRNSGTNIVFSTIKGELDRLQQIVKIVQEKRHVQFPPCESMPYESTIFYSDNKLPIMEEQTIMVESNSFFTFVPKLPEKDTMGVSTIILKWSNLMLPKISRQFIKGNVSSKTVSRLMGVNDILLPQFRVTKERYLAIQNMLSKPIEFKKPTTDQIIQSLFVTSDFSKVERSSAARYHTNFINRCGDLAQATHYLATSPYRELLEILSDNSNKSKLGWILENPSERRAVHHLHLREILRNTTPSETKKYFNTVSDELPTEAFDLLEKGLLERGFLLSCASCSYKSWYPTERVGQTFECARCFQNQVYNSNPLWLYKLPEVIFQGFKDNMHVPLLALNYLRQRSQHSFEWVPDSDVYRQAGDDKSHRNLDILCIVDGKFYVGEAKSNDEIETKQFSFYEEVCQRVAIDGIVFATSQRQWNKGTQQRIDSLKTWYKGEVLVLTEKELYPNTNSINQ